MGTARLGNLIDPVTNELKLVKWQMNFLTKKCRHKVAVCGRRSGKTTVASAMVYLKAVATKNQEIWVVALTYNQAKKLYFKELQKIIPRKWIREINKTDLTIELINGSIITLKGANNPDSLLGSGLDLLILDEFQSQDPELLDYLTPMLADRHGDLVLIGTPRGYNHLYEAWKRGQEDPNWYSVRVTTLTAGVIPKEEIDEARERMDPKMFEQEFNASFENMQGRTYYDFDPAHNVKPLRDNPNLPLWIGLDFNVDNMNAVVCQVPVVKGRKELHVIDEIQLTKDADTPKMIVEILRRYPNRDVIICPDASGRNRNSANGSVQSTNHALLKKAGFPLRFDHRGNPEILDRVPILNGLILNTNGVRRLFVDPKCKNVIKTLTQRINVDGKPLKDGKVDHMADALEYVVWQLFGQSSGFTVENF